MVTILREGILKLEFAVLILYAIIMIAKKVKLSKLLFNLSFGLYISLVIAVCFFPISIGRIGEDTLNNFIPFKSIIDSISEAYRDNTPYGIVSVLGNFVMLMPLGLFFSFYIKDFKRRLLSIFLFSVGIETIQFIIGILIGYNYRCIDIDDVILNVSGGILACICFNFILKKFYKKHNE